MYDPMGAVQHLRTHRYAGTPGASVQAERSEEEQDELALLLSRQPRPSSLGFHGEVLQATGVVFAEILERTSPHAPASIEAVEDP